MEVDATGSRIPDRFELGTSSTHHNVNKSVTMMMMYVLTAANQFVSHLVYCFLGAFATFPDHFRIVQKGI